MSPNRLQCPAADGLRPVAIVLQTPEEVIEERPSAEFHDKDCGNSRPRTNERSPRGGPVNAPGEGRPRGNSPRQSYADDLPDLTDRIVSLGLYEEYLRFRQGYLNWRQGRSRGARGE